ncbi:MAG TPA: MBL fold metallo-hydrolase [Bryobacteraceae bacterium]|nr:MBL fold metallo-hydrolase [Bryobacteraceae bacterium]
MSSPRFSTHFDGQRFFNPDTAQVRGFFDLVRWQITSRRERSPSFVSDVAPSKPPSCVENPDLRVTLINHSTVLLQQKDVHVLTDPIWSERASPLSWIGPRRHRAPGVRWEDLPRIDIVLLSHNHYDHLDLPTLRRLAGRGQTQFIAPLGVGRCLEARKIGPVHELDWGESVQIAGTTIHSVPSQHFSARGLVDRNRTLWCGFAIDTPDGMIYFAGDTGFGGHFARIRELFGAPRLALLPIGAYEPRWFMSAVHMAPEEAVRAHEILGARTSIAIHHGTFQLTDEGIDTPKQKLRACLAGDSFLMLDNGQSVTLAR